MSPAQIERTKLLAALLNNCCTSSFTVGIATPIAGYIYDVSGFRNALAPGLLILYAAGWMIAGALLHLLARRILGGLDR